MSSNATTNNPIAIPQIINTPSTPTTTPKTTTVNNNDKNSIEQLLRELSLEKYAPNFANFHIETFDEFLRLTEANLNEMGIVLFGPRKKLLSVIQQYNETNQGGGSVTSRRESPSGSIVVSF